MRQLFYHLRKTSEYELMPRWEVIGESVRGASHVRANLVNQDAVRVHLAADGLPAFLAVSDGHGSSKCLRSHEGSRFAVEIAHDELRSFAEFVSHERLPPPEIHRHAREQLPRKLWCKWRERVQQHFAEHPFADDELARLDESTAKSVRERTAREGPYVAYGATLVAVLLGKADWSTNSMTSSDQPADESTDASSTDTSSTDGSPHRGNYLVCLQLGDGEILVVSGDTHQVEQPIAPDADLIANETTSLCQDEAWEKFRISFRYLLEDRTPPLILLATDGYPNSFQTPDGFRQVASDLLNLLERDSVEVVRSQLPGWLASASEQGSGDDVSVAILYYQQPRDRVRPGIQPAVEPCTPDVPSAPVASSAPVVPDIEVRASDPKKPKIGPMLVEGVRRLKQAVARTRIWLRESYVIARRKFVKARRWYRRHPTAGLISTFVALLLAIYSLIVSGCLLLSRANGTS